MEENWFGLNRGQMTSVGTKVISTSQKHLACKISRIFVHWGPFYRTFWWSSLTLLPPFPKFSKQHLILDTFSYTFCFLKKKIWGDTKKDMGPSSIYALKATIFFLLTWGVWALGTNKCPHKPSKWVMRNENRTKIDWMEAKNNLSYFQEIWS